MRVCLAIARPPAAYRLDPDPNPRHLPMTYAPFSSAEPRKQIPFRQALVQYGLYYRAPFYTWDPHAPHFIWDHQDRPVGGFQ